MTLKSTNKIIVISSLLLGSSFSTPGHASFEELDNALLRSVTPTAPSFFQDVVADTKTQTFDRLKESTVTAYRLAKNVYQGDLTEIAATSIHLMLAKLAGRTNVALFHDNPDFDRRSLQVCAENLTKTFLDTLMATLNKDGTRYGRVRGTGQHVDIFNNRTFLQMVTDKILPEATPLRGVFMGIANNTLVDTYVRNKIAHMALKFVEGLVQNSGMTLRESTGEFVVSAFKKTPKKSLSAKPSLRAASSSPSNKPLSAEPSLRAASSSPSNKPLSAEPSLRAASSSPSNKPLSDEPSLRAASSSGKHVVQEELVPPYAHSFWQTLKPYILHEMRGMTRVLLDQSLKFSINKMDQILHNGALGLSVAGGATLGGVAMTLGGGIPYVGGLFSLFGAGTTLGSLGGGAVGGFTGSSFLDAVGKNTAKRMDAFSDVVTSQIIDYTPEEHALYGLNPKASQLERDLFPQDYARRDALTSGRFHTVVEIIRALSSANLGGAFSALCSGLDAEAKGVANALWSLFSATPTLSAQTAIEQSGLDKYIDHAARAHKENRSKAHRHFIAKSQSDTELARTVAQYPGYDMRMAQIKGFMTAPSEESRQLALKAKYATENLEYISWELAAELGPKISDESVYNILLNLSISEQDLLIDMKERNTFNSAYESLRESYSQLPKDITFDEEVEIILKEAIAQEAALRNTEYARTHKSEIKELRKLSLAHGLTEADIIDLHKALSVTPEKLNSVLDAPKEDLAQDSLEVMKRYYDESLATQRAMKMYNLFADSLSVQGVPAKVKKTTFERVISLPEPLSLKQMTTHVSDVISDTKEYKDAMNALRPIRDENQGSEFQKRVKSVFDARRIGLMHHLAQEVEQEVQEHLAKKASLSSEATQEVTAQTSSWMPSLWSRAEPTVSSSQFVESKGPAQDDFEIVGASKEPLTESSVREALAEDERKLVNFDSTAFGASRLIDAINAEREKFTEEADKEFMTKELIFFITIDEIMKDKRAALSSDEDRAFFDAHKKEINAFISGPDSPVKGRLWYSLQTVIDAFRAKNEIFLRSVLANQ